MRIFDIHEAKIQFINLVDIVTHGEEVAISIAGKPVAKLEPIVEKPKRRLGLLKGKIKIAKDFDAPLTENFEECEK